MRRAIVCDRNGAALFDLPPSDVFEMVIREEINGEHSLTVTTTRNLEKGWRILTQDGKGRWREHVVYGTDALHDAGERAFGTYYCTWSLQHDLMGTQVDEMPGVQVPCTAAVALDAALSGTARWARGTVTNTNTGGASMYDTDGWSAIAVMVGTWGGEVDAVIEVDDVSRTVTAREVDYYAAQGDQDAKRRYDFGADLASVRRTVEDGPLYCRMSPRGKGEETEGGGYGRKVTIESVNDGKDYLENAAMTDLAKLPNGSGGWEYPTIIAENSECETPADLKAWAQEVLDDYTVPKITYEVDVAQLAREGADLHGVSLGDAVHIVDRKFGEGLRVSARVVAATTNLLNEADVQLTLGHMNGGLAGVISGFNSQLAAVSETVKAMNGGNYSTADYLERLIDRINAEINATGGYAYIVPGHGILTFDAAVADPLDPVEASQVVEIKGGSIRIANTKTAQGQWEWKSVFTSGHIAAELVTAANLISGSIGSADGGNYWDLDNDLLRLAPTTIIDDDYTIDDLANMQIGNANLVRNGDFATGDVTYWVKSNSTQTSTISSDASFSSYLEYTQVSGGSGYGIYTHATTNFTHASGKTYSLSFYAKADAANTLTVKVGTSTAAANVYFNAVALGTSWQKFEATIKTTTTGPLRFYLEDAGTIYLANVMLVEGDRPMDFMQNPKDLYGTQTAAAATAAMIRAYGAGILVCRQGNTVGALVNADGSFDVVKVTWSGSTPTASTVYAKYAATSTIGESTAGHISVDSGGITLYGKKPGSTGVSEVIAKFGYAGTSSTGAAKFTLGTRVSGSTEGEGSVSIGWNNESSGSKSIAFGSNNTASGQNSFAVGSYNTASDNNAVAIGQNCTASYANTFAIGSSATAKTNQGAVALCAGTASGSKACAVNTATASGTYTFAAGSGTTASGDSCAAFGRYNSSGTNPLTVGWGTSSAKKNIMYLTSAGALWLASTLTQNSDRRLKQHVAYLGDDANVIINRLKPAVFVKDGGRHYGFYAQDVQRADIWDTKTVEAQHTDESLDFDPLTLDYTALIAPLTAYAQNLEKRVEQLEKRVEELERRLEDGAG